MCHWIGNSSQSIIKQLLEGTNWNLNCFWNICFWKLLSTPAGWINMKCRSDTHVPLRMNCQSFHVLAFYIIRSNFKPEMYMNLYVSNLKQANYKVTLASILYFIVLCFIYQSLWSQYLSLLGKWSYICTHLFSWDTQCGSKSTTELQG